MICINRLEDIPTQLEASVHIWCLPHQQPVTAGLLQTLDHHEQVRHQRFLFADDRDRYALSHALKRHCLSHYAAVAPAAWRFREGPHGKPSIAWAQPLHFNLSHTVGMTLCAVSHTELGVDVETTALARPIDGLATRFFAPSEAADVLQQPASARIQRFFAYWTLKEAYMKGVGDGLSLGLDTFTFQLNQPGEVIQLHLADHHPHPAAAWQFDRAQIGPHHPAALAVRRGAGQADLPVMWYLLEELPAH